MAVTTTTGHEIYATQTIKAASRQLAPLKTFSLDFSADAARKGDSINVSLITPNTAGEFDASNNNFKRSNQTLSQVSLQFGKPKITGFSVTPDQLNNFNPEWWGGKADLNTLELCDAALSEVAALITAANYGDGANDKKTVALAGFNSAIIAGIRGGLKEKKIRPGMATLCLSSVYFSQLLGTLDANVYGGAEAIRNGTIPGLLGFRAVVEFPQLDIPGFIATADAIACAARTFMPTSKKPYEAVNVITEPETGITLTHVEYCSGDDGEMNDSVNVLFKAGVGNKDALVRLVEAK